MYDVTPLDQRQFLAGREPEAKFQMIKEVKDSQNSLWPRWDLVERQWTWTKEKGAGQEKKRD